MTIVFQLPKISKNDVINLLFTCNIQSRRWKNYFQNLIYQNLWETRSLVLVLVFSESTQKFDSNNLVIYAGNTFTKFQEASHNLDSHFNIFLNNIFFPIKKRLMDVVQIINNLKQQKKEQDLCVNWLKVRYFLHIRHRHSVFWTSLMLLLNSKIDWLDLSTCMKIFEKNLMGIGRISTNWIIQLFLP